jgi:hypothetical protein
MPTSFCRSRFDGDVQAPIVDGALLPSSGRVAEHLADVGRGKFQSVSLQRIGQKTEGSSPPRCSLPYRGSAGLSSSVFLSSCAMALPPRSKEPLARIPSLAAAGELLTVEVAYGLA